MLHCTATVALSSWSSLELDVEIRLVVTMFVLLLSSLGDVAFVHVHVCVFVLGGQESGLKTVLRGVLLGLGSPIGQIAGVQGTAPSAGATP